MTNSRTLNALRHACSAALAGGPGGDFTESDLRDVQRAANWLDGIDEPKPVSASEATLRDYFAAQSLSVASDALGEMSVASLKEYLQVESYDGARHFPAAVAKKSYEFADAMLAARDQRGKG